MKQEDFERLKAVCEKEGWKEIDGYDGYYSISSLGNIRNNERGTLLSQSHDKDGYNQVSFKRMGRVKTHKPHRLVAIAFIPNHDNKPTVNHKNGIKDDNRVSNLEWNTYSENNKHSYSNLGKIAVTSRVGERALRNEPVLASLKCLKMKFYSVKNCADFLNIKPLNITKSFKSGNKIKGLSIIKTGKFTEVQPTNFLNHAPGSDK